MGGFRRAIAALVALALLVLPGAPMRHASTAPMHEAPSHLVAAHHCAGHDEGVVQDHALASHHDDHGQRDQPPGAQQGLACCASAQCPATVAVPPLTPAQPAPLPDARVVAFAIPAAPDGIAVDPALHPPRRLA